MVVIQNELFVADPDNNVVQVFSLGGVYSRALTMPSPGRPLDLATDSSGDLYVALDSGQKVLKVDRTTGANLITPLSDGVYYRGIGVDATTKTIFASSGVDAKVHWFKLVSGNYVTQTPFGSPVFSGGTIPTGIVKVGPDIYITNVIGNNIVHFTGNDSTGYSYAGVAVSITAAYEMTRDASGLFFVPSYGQNKFTVFNPDWSLNTTCTNAGYGDCYGIAVDSSDMVYLTSDFPPEQVVQAYPCLVTNTATSTPTSTGTSTPTQTATNTATDTPTDTATDTATHTVTPTPTHTATDTATHTMTPTLTHTATNTVTDTASNTATHTFSMTATKTPTITYTSTSTGTATNTSTITATNTATHTATITATNSMTQTPTKTGTNSPTSTATKTSTYTGTNTPTRTPTDTYTPTLTFTNTVTSTPTHTRTPTDTPTVTPTVLLTCNEIRVNRNAFFPGTSPLSMNVKYCDVPGHYSLRVYNSAGEYIKTVDERELTIPFSGTVYWDGNNRYGGPCTSGVYVLHLSEPYGIKVKKVVLIR
jgi:hypothetical protein